ncbi:hypothetical protein B0H16DRAFT_1460307 [Mycena metata]|uniref:Uncharacterized protein n=1 Tax=Mycena metata TaxID=1033252 RepID=A0AAD7IVK5_9AGAR|nr:hypothetical protein B0H16DRAFT_1460307 [Mycena metata]
MPLVEKVLTLLPHSGDHQAKASFAVMLFGVQEVRSIPHPETLIAQIFEWLKTLDDSDLECCFYSYLDMPRALKYSQMGLSSAQSHGNIRRQTQAFLGLSWIEWQLLQTYQGGQLYYEALSLMNIAQVEVLMGVSYNVIQEKTRATLNFREGDMSTSLFHKCLKSGWGQFNEEVSHCLERLADITGWSSGHDSSWSIVFLVHSLRAKEKLGIYKALQFIGDVHLMEDVKITAVSLFTVALDGFTYMDVHHSRAECMIRLSDIAKKNGDLLKALELCETARPLFERSSQTKRVQDVDERVGDISEEVKEQHQKNLAKLAELNVPAGQVEDMDSDAEELELAEEQVRLIAA